MQFSLARMAARKRKSRRPVTFAPIFSTKAQADSLAAIYGLILEPWARAAEIMADAYSREVAQLSDSSGQLVTDSAGDLGATTDSIAAAINRLVLELTPSLRQWALRVEEWHRGKWTRTVLSGADVDLDLIIGAADVRETVDAWLVRQTSLIRDVNEQARGKVADAVLRGFQRRASIAEVTKEVREATGFARARARRISADQTVKLSSALDDERRRQAGLDFGKYHHSGKMHPRPEHRARNGKIYELDTGREVTFANGSMVYGPDTIEPSDRPGIPPFCGCVFAGVLVFEGEVL